MSLAKPNNISDYVKSETDIGLFVHTIANHWSETHTKETDDRWANLPYQAKQLIWITAAYFNGYVCPSERTVPNMQKLLSSCYPISKRCDGTPFEVIITDTKEESLIKKYDYFELHTFGVHSNCYREVVRMSIEALQEITQESVAEAFTNATEEERASHPAEDLFGPLEGITGQEFQMVQYEAYDTALHEAGHAVAYYLLGMDFAGVTIQPTDRNMGHVGRTIKHNVVYEPHKEAIAMYAGEIAVEVVLKQKLRSAWSAYNDCKYATKIIKQEVIQELSNPRDTYQYVFINADVLGLADKESPYIIYETIRRCVALRQEAVELITTHKDLVSALADELLKKQSMPREDVIQFLDDWKTQQNPQ